MSCQVWVPTKVGVVRLALVSKTTRPVPTGSEILENHWAEVAAEKNVMLSVAFGTANPPSVSVGALKVTLDCMIREASVVSVASAADVFQAIVSRLASLRMPLVAGFALLEAKIGEESEVVATVPPEKVGLTRVGPLE